MDQIVKFVGVPLCWYGLGKLNPDDLRRHSFAAGQSISQKFKQYISETLKTTTKHYLRELGQNQSLNY
jgi:hypothetical protein